MDKRLFKDWDALITRTFNIVRESATQRGLELTSDVTSRLPVIEAHEGYLENALQRLLENAIKFSRSGSGQITVTVRSDNGSVVLSVIDQGIGIPTAEIPRIFEKFHQINREKFEQQGAGIGLAIVRSIVELHHGEIECVSQEGVGSEFRLRFPVA